MKSQALRESLSTDHEDRGIHDSLNGYIPLTTGIYPGKRDAEVKVVVGATTSEVHLIAEFYGPQPQSLVVTVRDRA
jgi:hypothetical protein